MQNGILILLLRFRIATANMRADIFSKKLMDFILCHFPLVYPSGELDEKSGCR